MEKAGIFPKKGRTHQELIQEMESMKVDDARWKEGRTWSMVYHVTDEHKDFIKDSAQRFFSESYINPFAFKSLQRMEKEIIAMTRELLNGGDSVVGTMTSGGTESIFLSLYTYREHACKERKIRKDWEVVAPESIHPAFEKAAHILGIKIKKTPVNDLYKADIAAMESLITNNTILLAVSAPSYPHGILDPIPEASALALRHQLPLHVDSCIGGFVLPWIEALTPDKLPQWDFRLKGVTSISADTHKFAYGGKGSSVLLYRDMEYLRHQFFITTDWAGGIYASATFMGSRAGGPIASAWASMQSLGRAGYLDITKQIMGGVNRLKEGILAIDGLELIGDPCMNIIAFTSKNKSIDIFVVGDYLSEKNWYVDRQQRPNCIHLTVMKQNLPIIDEYLKDLNEAVAYAKNNRKAKAKGDAALYGLMARLPFRGMVANNVRQLFEDLYSNEACNKGYNKDISTEKSQSTPEPARWMGLLNRLLSNLPGKR